MAINESAIEQGTGGETGERKTKRPVDPHDGPAVTTAGVARSAEQPQKEQRQGAVPKDAYKLLAINTGRSSTAATPYAKVGCISREGRTTILLAKAKKVKLWWLA